MIDLSGRVAVITGGARGQGRAHALALAAAGANIAICDACADFSSVPYPLPDESDLRQTVKLVEALDRRCVAVKADVTQAEQMEGFVAQVVGDLGRIDFLIANAGIWSIGGPMWEMSETTFDETMAIDVKGVWLTCKYVLPRIIEQGAGSVVLTSSVAALKAYPNIGHYSAAKAAVLAMMRTLASELAPHNIRVNAILPGMVNTDMIFFEEQYRLFSPDNPTRDGYLDTLEAMMPMPGRFTEPADQAAAALWLCSDDSRFVSGVELSVAGAANVSM